MVKQYPYVLGAGIPMFHGTPQLLRFEPAARRAFDDGVTIVRYRKADRTPQDQ